MGVVHHVFYEIFDHFGPQYGWWTWNYANFPSAVASVPTSSMVGFAFAGPVALTLASRALLGRSKPPSPVTTGPTLKFAAQTLVAGLLTPLLFIMLTLNTWYSVLGIPLTPQSELIGSAVLLAVALLLTLYQFLRQTGFSKQGLLEFSKAYLALFTQCLACCGCTRYPIISPLPEASPRPTPSDHCPMSQGAWPWPCFSCCA